MAQEIIQINKATPVGKRRVCAYTRVSSKSEDQENSLTYQIEAYTKMIMTNPSYEFCGVFVDDGVTGTSIYKRKEFIIISLVIV
jgi:predicted site-specific integrase-resolvase